MSNGNDYEIALLHCHTSFKGEQRLYQHYSPSLGRQIKLEIYVPVAQLKDKPCVVVYYIPSLQTNASLVATQSDFQRYANRYDCIVVIPDIFGHYAGTSAERVNQYWQEREQVHHFISDGLPSVINHNFNAYDVRSIMGYGFGGTVALNMSLEDRLNYRSASALAPWVGFYGTGWFETHLQKYGIGPEIDPLMNLKAKFNERLNPMWIDQGLNDAYLGEQINLEPFEALLKTHPQAEQMWINWHKRYDHSFYFVHSFIREHFVFHAEYHENA